VRTPEQLIEAKKIMAGEKLMRSSNFKIWMMVEVPVNVISIEEFIKAGIDGVSIGSNDLTQLIMGIDRDNEHIAQDFNEKNPAVLWALERTIKACKKHGITASICGQAPSDYPDLVEMLVKWGITSVSVNPDAVNSVRMIVSKCEKKLLSRSK
jgi:pyruvate,water dikinase